MEGVLLETQNRLAHGRMDLPLSLCFSALGGDDLLLHQSLKWGLDPNESDNNGTNKLHIAGSEGTKNAALLLDHGGDPKSRDSEGNVPQWEAIMANHESLVEQLTDNGATISSVNDIDQFACTAVEQNNLGLFKEIVCHGGEVTHAKNDDHVEVCEGNTEILNFLLDHGNVIGKPDYQGWTPRGLADQQGHEDTKGLFRSTKVNGRDNDLLSYINQTKCMENGRDYPARVKVSCPEMGDFVGKLAPLPWSLQELLEVGDKKFGFLPPKVLKQGWG